MPFTLAHPAIILPLKLSKRFSITALIAGSMVPDFEFFFQMREVKNIGHHWYGILLFDFPVALLFCFLFHNLLRNLLIHNLPESFKYRVVDVIAFNWNSYASNNKLSIGISLIIGIASHLFWDGFTHHDGLFVNLFPILSENKVVFGFNVPLFFLLQLIFSIEGLLFISFEILRLPKQQNNSTQRNNKWYWPLFAIVLLLIICIRLTVWPQYNSLWSVFMAVMGGICYSWLIISILLKN